MAMLNNPMPYWLVAEQREDFRTMKHDVKVAIRCREGYVHVLNVPVDLDFMGHRMHLPLTKRELLEEIHENITVQLARLTLEET